MKLQVVKTSNIEFKNIVRKQANNLKLAENNNGTSCIKIVDSQLDVHF